MDLKHYNFWEVIKLIDWQRCCKCENGKPAHVTARENLMKITRKDGCWRFILRKTAEGYRSVLEDKIRDYSLENHGSRYSFPWVGDDTFYDLTAHIVVAGRRLMKRC